MSSPSGVGTIVVLLICTEIVSYHKESNFAHDPKAQTTTLSSDDLMIFIQYGNEKNNPKVWGQPIKEDQKI